MSTEQTKTPASNRAVFGPLGKYAIVAVFIVSIIVTTAIMLEKQLGTTEERLAAIQTELHIAENSQENTNKDSADTAITSDHDSNTSTESTEPVVATSTTTQTVAAFNHTTDENITDEQVAISPTAETSAVGETADSVSTPVVTPVTTTVATKTTTEKTPDNVATAKTATVKTTASVPVVTATIANDTSATAVTAVIAPKTVANDTAIKQKTIKPAHKNLSSEQRIARMKARQEKINAEHQARIAAIKDQQKATLSAMFKRIEALEARQVNAYASSQDRQIAALRNQLQRQQGMIDSLIVHNNEMLNTRKVNIERVQQQRQAILNRI